MGKGLGVRGSLDSMREKQRTMSSHSVLSRFLIFNLFLAQTEYGEHAESQADQQVRSHVTYMDTESGHAIDLWVPITPLFSTLIKLVAVCLFDFFFVTATPKNHCPSLKTGTVKQDRMTFIGNVTRRREIPKTGCNLICMCRLLIRNKVTPPRLKFQSDWANLMGTELLHGAILMGLLFDPICIIAPRENPTLDCGTGQLAAGDRRLSRLSPGDCCRTGGESVTMADDCGDPGRPLTSGVSRSLIATALLPLSRGYSHRCPPAPCLCVGLF